MVPLVLQQLPHRLDPMGTGRLAAAQLRHHEVVQLAADGGLRPGHRQDVLAQPPGQHRHVLGQRDRLGLGLPRVAELLGQILLLPALPPLGGGLLSLELGAGVDRLVGPVLQVTDQRPEFVQRMEDITAAGDPGQGLLMAGAEPRGEIGDGGLGGETPVDQLEEAHPPGVGVAMLFLAQQVAVGGRGVDADEDGATGLEDLVIGTDADAGQVLAIG